MRIIGSLLLTLAIGGCRKPAFVCSSNEACTRVAAVGVCEPTRFCSFPDPSCPGSNRRYGEFSGTLGGRCVAEGPTDGPILPASWKPLAATGPAPRHSAKMVYDSARRRMVLFGGASGTTIYQ